MAICPSKCVYSLLIFHTGVWRIGHTLSLGGNHGSDFVAKSLAPNLQIGSVMPKYTVRFMTVSGDFKTSHERSYATHGEGAIAVQVYADANGFTDVKCIDDSGDDRYTPKTPGGRGGRNIAFGGWSYESDF